MLLIAPVILVKVPPASVLTCHWTVGVGFPLAEDVKEAELPAHTALFVGLLLNTGVVFTVTVALPVAVPEQFASLIVLTV